MLSTTKIQNAKAKDRPYKLYDAQGLYVLVNPNGSKLWRYRYKFEGRAKLLAVGKFPAIGLKVARERAEDARRQIAEGSDPSQAKLAQKAAQGHTFQMIAEEWIKAQTPRWKERNVQLTRSRLTANVFPELGKRPITSITAPDVLRVVRRIEARGAGETAKRVLAICGQVFRYAVATGKAERDPTGDLRGALVARKPGHRAAVTEPKALGALLRAMDGYEGRHTTAAALQLLPLLFVRPGELRNMEWREIQGNVWEIPGEKMKTGQPHIVPLSRQALAILDGLKPATGSGRLVFPSDRSAMRPISDMAMTAALRRMGFDKTQVTPHGFRATARTLLAERLQEKPELIEHQLAHLVRDPLGRAYNRTQFLPERKQMMQRWADFLDSLKKRGEVVALSA